MAEIVFYSAEKIAGKGANSGNQDILRFSLMFSTPSKTKISSFDFGLSNDCVLRAISPFPTVFLNDLYSRHVKTRACLGKG